MAAAKDAKTKLNAQSLRESSEAQRAKLLADTRTDLLEAKRLLKAQELANPRKVKEMRRNIALIMTVENEPKREQKEEA